MSATAGAAVQAVDGDNAQRAFAFGRLAEPLHQRRVFEMHRDRPVLKDDLVGAPLGRQHRPRLHCSAFQIAREIALQIDGRALRAQVEADGMQREHLLEDGRKQVLAGMLLHVVQTAVPVDGARHFALRHRFGQAMRDARFLIHHVEHGNARDGAGVERLSAGGWVKGRAVEVDAAAVLGNARNAGPEIVQVGVGVVEAFSHGDTAIVAESVRLLFERPSVGWSISRVCERPSSNSIAAKPPSGARLCDTLLGRR
jgi:hypothetical protein